jgi:hypothetical protein
MEGSKSHDVLREHSWTEFKLFKLDIEMSLELFQLDIKLSPIFLNPNKTYLLDLIYEWSLSGSLGDYSFIPKAIKTISYIIN